MARKGPQNDETIASFLTFFTTSVSYNESKYVVFPNMCFVNMGGSQVSLSSGRGCQLGYFFSPRGTLGKVWRPIFQDLVCVLGSTGI